MILGKVEKKVILPQQHKRTVPIHVNDMMETVLYACHPQMAY